jgi:rhodanese-related sulfurtransferase
MEHKISTSELKQLLDTGASVKVLDVRLVEDRAAVDHPIPGAEWRNPDEVGIWVEEIGGGDQVVVYCVHGRHVSQGVCAKLREKGIRASYLEGGIEGWGELVRSGATKAGK